jgi:hypothetical protein
VWVSNERVYSSHPISYFISVVVARLYFHFTPQFIKLYEIARVHKQFYKTYATANCMLLLTAIINK